jgi:hypothetical protein
MRLGRTGAALLVLAPLLGAGCGLGPATPAEQPAPLKGWIDVTVTEKGNPRRQRLHLRAPGALPLQVGDEVRVEAELSRPAHAYIVWIDTRGKVLPVYPWREGEWSKRPIREEPVRRISLPEKEGDVWGIDPGPAGLETLLLLMREQPLGPDVDLREMLADIGRQPMGDERDVAWFENGLPVRDEPERGLRLKSEALDNPVLRINALVQKRLGRHFSCTRGVTFANRGGSAR